MNMKMGDSVMFYSFCAPGRDTCRFPPFYNGVLDSHKNQADLNVVLVR